MKRGPSRLALGSVLLAALWLGAGAVDAQIRLFEHADYRGGSRTFDRDQRDLDDQGFNDKTSSFRIESGTWELCIRSDYRNCRIFRDGESDLTRLRDCATGTTRSARCVQRAGTTTRTRTTIDRGPGSL